MQRSVRVISMVFAVVATASATAQTLTKSFSPTTIADGAPTVLTFTVANPAGAPAKSNVGFVDTLPSGLRVANPPLIGGTCSNAAAATTAPAGSGTISVFNLNVPAGPSTCTMTVRVTNLAGIRNGDCNSNPVAFTNASANVSVTNVINGVQPSCVMSAEPVVATAVSRKTHGLTTYDLALNAVSSDPTTEPRGGAHTIVFVFNKAVAGGNAGITEGVATAGSPTFGGNEMRVPLTGVTDAQYVTVAVSGVTGTDGSVDGSGSIRIGFLQGDVNQNRVVTLSDLGQVNAQIAQFVTAVNYLKDVNASGTLTLTDKALTNAQLTKALPAP